MDFETNKGLITVLIDKNSINLILWILKQMELIDKNPCELGINLILWILKHRINLEHQIDRTVYKFDPMDFET